MESTGSTAPKPIDDYTFDLAGPPINIRPEVLEAFRAVHHVLEKGLYAACCAALDEDRAAPYHSHAIEKAARAFEIFLIGRLAMNGISNPYLTKPREELLDAYPLPQEMEAGICQAYDSLFSTLDTRETENGVAIFAKSTRRTGSACGK